MIRPPQDRLSVWIMVLLVALVAVLVSSLAVQLPAQLEHEVGSLAELVRLVLPLGVSVVIAVVALWASRQVVDAAHREASRELEFAQIRSELAMAQKAREQRHDLVNHLTVIAALIQLGSTDQALAYLQRAIHHRTEEGGETSAEHPNEPGILLGLLGQKLTQAARAGVVVDLRVESRADTLCMPDVVAARILGNLADNAIDAAGEAEPGAGRVTVELVLSEQHCWLRVWNNGPAIPPENLKRIFAAGETTKGGEHRGLGLAIVQELVREYGGSLTVRSDPGSGTEFVVRFDRRRPKGDRTAAGRGVKLRSWSI